jgi:hypothetical protein
VIGAAWAVLERVQGTKRLKLAAVAFNQALTHHQMRDLVEAKRMYSKALELMCMCVLLPSPTSRIESLAYAKGAHRYESSDQGHLINVSHAYCNLASLYASPCRAVVLFCGVLEGVPCRRQDAVW